MNDTSRRVFMMQVATASTMLLGRRAIAQGAPRLQETDPEAVAVGYKQDHTKIDKARFPKKAANDHCTLCKAFMGKPGDAWANCALVDEKLVNANGWCSSYVLKA